MFGALTAISATATEDERQDFAEFGLFRCAWVVCRLVWRYNPGGFCASAALQCDPAHRCLSEQRLHEGGFYSFVSAELAV